MQVAHPVPKSGRRVAFEAPHADAHAASLDARMGKGVMPKGLPRLVEWFMEMSADELPVAIHRSGVWHDPGDGMGDPEAGKGSRLSTPAHTDAFVRFMRAVDSPSALDQDGHYRYPVRACLSRLSRRNPLTARMLYRLSIHGGNWRTLADQMSYPDEFMELYLERALHLCWREFSEQRMRLA